MNFIFIRGTLTLGLVLSNLHPALTIEITSGPQNVTTTIGGEITFQCQYEGTTDLPQWRINGDDYVATDLPPWHLFIPRDRRLRVTVNNLGMNNSEYICFLDGYNLTDGRPIRVLSQPPAYLRIHLEEKRSTTEVHLLHVTSSSVSQISSSPPIPDLSSLILMSSFPQYEESTISTIGHTGSFDVLKHNIVQPTLRSSPATGDSSNVFVYVGIGCGVALVTSAVGVVVVLGVLIWFQQHKRHRLKVVEPVYDTVTDPTKTEPATSKEGRGPVYDIVLEVPAHIDEKGGIAMQHNSAYVIPPPRLKIKVKQNEAYSDVRPQN